MEALSFYLYDTGILVSHYVRSIGIPCSLDIDDRHTSQLRDTKDSSLRRLGLDKRQFNLACAHMAAFLVCYTLVNLGYFISLQKSKAHSLSVCPLPTRLLVWLSAAGFPP